MYQNSLYTVIDDDGVGLLIENERVRGWVSYSDPDLIIDPTDDDVASTTPDKKGESHDHDRS